MFSKLFQTKSGSLFEQCAEKLREASPNASIEEVKRLVVLVSHEISDSYSDAIESVLKDVINEFTDNLPEVKGKHNAGTGRLQREHGQGKKGKRGASKKRGSRK